MTLRHSAGNHQAFSLTSHSMLTDSPSGESSEWSDALAEAVTDAVAKAIFTRSHPPVKQAISETPHLVSPILSTHYLQNEANINSTLISATMYFANLTMGNVSTNATNDTVVLEDTELFERYYQNRALDSFSLVTLAIVYTVLIFIGTLGNGLVCLAVARQPKMRTSRNLFIINLAISDLLLCFFTIPFSLIEISTKSWPYGESMCKLVATLEATSIFVSTFSITAISLDRYQVILQSMNPDQYRRGQFPPLAKLMIIWVIGMLLSMPLFLCREVEVHKIGIPELDPIKFCIEKWPIQHGRGYYSIFSMLMQYFVPIIIVTVVYTRLCIKLRTRTLRRTSTTQLPKLRTRLQRRARKTNMLLISIALIFCISWLPLNVLNIVADLYYTTFFPGDNSEQTFRITFAICHMAGMSSSCSNPFLYGWLNQNFRNEFNSIFTTLKRCFMRVCFHQQPEITMAKRNGHSTTLTANHELIHYQTKNTDMMVTDYENAIPVSRRGTRNVAINVEKRATGNGNAGEKKGKGKNRFLSEPTSGSLREANTSHLYLSTSFGAAGDSPLDAAGQTHFEKNRRKGFTGNRFKRLSLTDSRKRRKKKEASSHLSISALATESTIIMDSNNNDSHSNSNKGADPRQAKGEVINSRDEAH